MSLEIIRVTEHAGIDYIEDLIIADCDETKEEILQIVKSLMSDHPHRTLVLQALDTESKDEYDIQAFIIAWAPVTGNYSFIIQAWKKLKPVDPRVMERLFSRLQYWSDSLGKTEIRGETTRKTEPFLRKWNFEHLSSVLRYTIPQDFELPPVKDSENGTTDNDSNSSRSRNGSLGEQQGQTSSVPENNESREHKHGAGSTEAALSESSTGSKHTRVEQSVSEPVTSTETAVTE